MFSIFKILENLIVLYSMCFMRSFTYEGVLIFEINSTEEHGDRLEVRFLYGCSQ